MKLIKVVIADEDGYDKDRRWLIKNGFKKDTSYNGDFAYKLKSNNVNMQVILPMPVKGFEQFLVTAQAGVSGVVWQKFQDTGSNLNTVMSSVVKKINSFFDKIKKECVKKESEHQEEIKKLQKNSQECDDVIKFLNFV